MDILGITTSSLAGSVSVFFRGMFFTKKLHSSVMNHSSLLLPAVKEVCENADISLKNIDTVSVDVGPGSFTGVRLALACSSAFSLSLGLTCTGVSSLDIMAERVLKESRDADTFPYEFIVIIDAGREEFYGAKYFLSSSDVVNKKSEESLYKEEDLVPLMDEIPIYGYFHRRNVSKLRDKCHLLHPDAESLIKAALKNKGECKPNYIRSPHVILKKI